MGAGLDLKGGQHRHGEGVPQAVQCTQKSRSRESFRELRRQEFSRHSPAMLVQQEIGRRALAPVGTADTADDPGALLSHIPVRMIEQPKRRIDCPRPVSLCDVARHADKWIAIEVGWTAITDLVDGQVSKRLTAPYRPNPP